MFKDFKDMPTPVDICTVFGVRSLLLVHKAILCPSPLPELCSGQPVCGIASWSKMGNAAFPFRKTRLQESVLPELASWQRRPRAYCSNTYPAPALVWLLFRLPQKVITIKTHYQGQHAMANTTQDTKAATDQL